ncbi:FMN-binding negative transcriptional regulator [Halomonas nitroreducens]|uniref:FMN-binding negative transcriptional regulator n=1 Tax=Halomonas nitroreducens TaxID=447425 RepID=A0A3S0JUL0_9GAMM|nr:FMN-binding negative transcriptional regulator [Halomonas nitroreducens]RTR00460.1 FMN-binding negative transcriptional regulator [Halomonas nitroreducens]
MHVPETLRMAGAAEAQAFIDAHSFGFLLTPDLEATHLPLVLRREEGELGTLYGHVARANPHWRTLDHGEALVVFSGPHAYISPRWYAEGPAVPTWNYAVVHARGRIRLLDAAGTRQAVRELVAVHEPTLLDDEALMPVDFETRLLQAVVGFRLEITSLDGKHKLGQHRRPADQRGVYRALSEASDGGARALAAYMQCTGLGTGE